MREWEELGKRAQKKQDEIARDIKAIQNAVRNPETAKKGGVDVREKAKKNLERLKREQQRWKNWHTDAELMDRLKGETAPKTEVKEQMPETESPKAEVKEPATAEPAAEAKAEPEAKVAEKAESQKAEIEESTSSAPVVKAGELPSEMPTPDKQKELKDWLKNYYNGKPKPLNRDKQWYISVPVTGLKETLNHLYRKRVNYRSDLHFRSLPIIDTMLEQAVFDHFEPVQEGKIGDQISIFNVTVDFGKDGIYNARMVVKHFGDQKNYYDHKLTTFEALPDSRLQSEDSGRLSNASGDTVTPETEKSSEAAGKVEEKAETKNGQPRPDLHDYLDANVDMSA
ncbi:MAG: hypothetical protein MR727_05505, partial [Lentisphaeria bacterium]|nr:hypothetical protein [Lentisphaeria bacterium]